MSDYTTYQQNLINRMQGGGYDYTFGPGSPNATPEDLQTYVGGRYSPAGGFATPGGYALAPSDYYSFTPQQRRDLGIMDIAPTNQVGQLERYFPKGGVSLPGRIAQSGRNLVSNVGDMFGGGDSYWGQGNNLPGFIGQSGGVPYYPEGSRMSETLGPALEQADSGGYSGADIRNIIGNEFSGNLQASTNPLDYLNPFGNTTQGGSGTGVPTQKAIGTTVGTLSNFVFPGLGFLTGPMARYVTNLIQHGVSPQQAVKQAQAQAKDSGDNAPSMPSGSVDLPTHGGGYDPGAGADPTGRPTTGREWYSQDFGRTPGMSPGNYNNPLTPGGGPGTLGVGGTTFGPQTVGNFATAIGFDRLGAGQGSTNLSAMGGGPAASQMRQIMKGIYTPMTGYGYGPLGGFTGTGMASAQANIAGQQQLHDILMANPGALSGPISGNITRGVPMKQSAQMGSSDIQQNPGLRLFMAGRGLRKPKPKKPKI